MNATNVKKHLPPSIATSKGHLNKQWQNVRSTNPKQFNEPLEPTQSQEDKSYHTSVALGLIDHNGVLYIYLKGNFLLTSSKGNKYILIPYDYDSNEVIAEPMKDRGDKEMLETFYKIYTYLTDRGFKPKLNILDNK